MTVIFKTLMYSKATISELFNMETSISVLIFFDKIEVHQPSHMHTTESSWCQKYFIFVFESFGFCGCVEYG